MQEIHSDIVSEPIPSGFHLIGSSEKTPVQGFVHFYPDPDPEQEEKKSGKSKDSTPEEQEETEHAEKKEAGKKVETGDAPEFTHSADHELPEGLWRHVHIIAFQGESIAPTDETQVDPIVFVMIGHPEWYVDRSRFEGSLLTYPLLFVGMRASFCH